MTEDEVVELMAEAIFDEWRKRAGSWPRAKEKTKNDFRAEARAAFVQLRLHGIVRR